MEALKASIANGYVHLKFTDMRGGTELGVRLCREATHVEQGDFVRGIGNVHLEGNLSLNYRDVRCLADIDYRPLTDRGTSKWFESNMNGSGGSDLEVALASVHLWIVLRPRNCAPAEVALTTEMVDSRHLG